MNKAIILVSGGMDSLVTTAIAMTENEEVNFLHINYGQRTEDKELECFYKICEYYQPHNILVLNFDWLGNLGGSALTDKKIEIKDYNGSKTIPHTYVPFRNANLISAAVSWAEVIKANRIYIGAVEEDSSGYPDCRKVFFEAMQKAIIFGTKQDPPITLMTPVIDLEKSQIVKKGIELKVPFEYSWSCYKQSDLACGVCDSCYLRLRAFHKAGCVDPLPYDARR